jgi:hypothetical protein
MKVANTVTSAAELATRVKVASPSVATAAVVGVAAAEFSTAVSPIKSASVATLVSAPAIKSITSIVTIAMAIVSATIVPIGAVSVIAVIPGSGTDKEAADEPVWSVVSVGSTIVRIIVVVAVRADWRGAVINGTANSHTEGDALSVGVRS